MNQWLHTKGIIVNFIACLVVVPWDRIEDKCLLVGFVTLDLKVLVHIVQYVGTILWFPVWSWVPNKQLILCAYMRFNCVDSSVSKRKTCQTSHPNPDPPINWIVVKQGVWVQQFLVYTFMSIFRRFRWSPTQLAVAVLSLLALLWISKICKMIILRGTLNTLDRGLFSHFF